MQYHDLVQLYFERAGAAQSLWTLYVVILASLLAFSSLRHRRDVLTTALISALFLIFAYRNLDGLHEVLAQRDAALQALKQMADTGLAAAQRTALQATMQPNDYGETRVFHVIADVLVIVAIWTMEWRRRHATQP